MKPEEIAEAATGIARDIDDRGRRLRFEYAGVAASYRSDEDASGTWIERFFEGYHTPSVAGDADAALYSTGDQALLSALRRLTAEQPAAGVRASPAVPLTDSVAVVRKVTKARHPEEAYLLLFRQERTIVLATSGDPEVRREEGMQLLRAVTKWLLLERGWIPMHSACAAKNGRTICVTGLKAAGKTSTLLNLLARNGCDLVAVDKFLVRDGESSVDVCGIPGKIGIRVGSAVVQPELLHWLAEPSAHFFPHLGPEEVRHIAATNTPEQLRTRSEKIHLTPAELAGLFGASITPTAPLGLLLIPVYDPDVQESRLAPVEPPTARRMLTECYVRLRSKGEGFLQHFFDLSDGLLEDRLAALLDEHLVDVPAYEVHQNHRTNERTAELVAGLL